MYDAIVLVSFGGPERREEVLPFLENVLRGKNVPRERMLEVAEHYYHFEGKSPINEQNRALIRALEAELAEHGPKLPVYWGNRNWHPLLEDTLKRMAGDGVRHAIGFVTSAFGSYSGCRQYIENIAQARERLGETAPVIHKLPPFFNRHGFIDAMIDRCRSALAQLPGDAKLVFTAHSVPVSMAETSPYEAQLRESCGLVASAVGRPDWRLVYQSRSGPPTQPWLEPDIGDALEELASAGDRNVVVCPIGFLSDHMEVLYDLDHEAAELARKLDLHMVRAGTAGVHPRFIGMIREMVQECMSGAVIEPCDPACCPRPSYR